MANEAQSAAHCLDARTRVSFQTPPHPATARPPLSGGRGRKIVDWVSRPDLSKDISGAIRSVGGVIAASSHAGDSRVPARSPKFYKPCHAGTSFARVSVWA